MDEGVRSVTVDIFHDTACPWCRIGKAHLDAALAGWDGPPVAVRWRPFLLDPTIPPEGLDFRAYLGLTKGGAARLPLLFDTVHRAGAAAGLTFRFDLVERAPNTTLSHQLIAFAPAERKDATVEVLHQAYFEEGRDIGRRDVLVTVAGEAGLDVSAVEDDLGRDDRRAVVAAEAAWARRQGVTSVPLFIVNGAVAVAGAQPPAALLRFLRTAVLATR